VPQNTGYLGCSHGYLIFTYEEHCLLIDAYTGAKVKAPELPRDITIGFFSGIGVLTAPFGSPNSRLLLFSKDSVFEWQVGTNSWSEHPLYLERECICQVVSFKGHILVIDALMRLHTIQLTPQFSVNRIEVSWWSLQKFPICPLLVVCGDMLLLVNLSIAKIGSTRNFGEPSVRYFEVFRLDLSVKPAKWIQMKKLENLVLFLSLDRRNPAFSCMNPERWGGKSNCIYVARLFDDANPDETWTVLEVGQSVPSHDIVDPMPYGMGFPPDYSLIGSFWLFPSLVYGVGQ